MKLRITKIWLVHVLVLSATFGETETIVGTIITFIATIEHWPMKALETMTNTVVTALSKLLL